MIQQKLTLYRLHFINPKTGQIGHTYDFQAIDDVAALQFAAVWEEAAPMELWGPKTRLKQWERRQS